MTAKEWLQNKYPSMKEHWNEHDVINDNWVADVMTEFAASLNTQGCRWTDDLIREFVIVTHNKWHGEVTYESLLSDFKKSHLPESIEPCATSLPDKFVGKWCISEPRGTHGSYDILSEPYVFETRADADKYKRKVGKTSDHYAVGQVMKVDDFNGLYPSYEDWVSVTILPSPTGDRDCEELKKEVERLKGLIEKLHSEAYSINPVKWWNFKRENNI